MNTKNSKHQREEVNKAGAYAGNFKAGFLIPCRCDYLVMLLAVMILGWNISSARELSSRIADTSGKAIQGATISDSHKAVFSKADGSFSINTASDSLKISRIGYQPLSLSVFRLPDPIILQSLEIIMPLVRVMAIDYRSSTPALDSQQIYPDTNSSPVSASDILNNTSSFSTTDTQLLGERQTISLLGSFSRHALVMLDGIPLNTAGEAFDFNQIPVKQISYIEVIKGSSSVYGGSAAIGGIINIHTLNPVATNSLEVSQNTSVGSFGMHKEEYSGYWTKGIWSLGGEYKHYSADNDFLYDPPVWWGLGSGLKRLHNRKISDGVFLKTRGGYADYQFDYTLNYGSYIRQLPGPISFLELYDDSRLTGNNLSQTLKINRAVGKLSLDLAVWRSSDNSIYRNLASTNPVNASHYSQGQNTQGLKSQNILQYKDSRFDLLAEFTNQDYKFENRMDNKDLSALITGSRTNSALALRAEQKLYLSLLNYTLTGAARMDHNAQTTYPTWRLEQLFTMPVVADIRLGAAVGTGFSLPSLYDMFWIGDSETQGNPALKSETSLGSSVWTSLDHSFFGVKAAYYHNKIQELIQWRQTYLFGVTWKPFNIGTAVIQNWELEANIKPHKYLSLEGGITFTKAMDMSLNADGSTSSTYNKRLPYTPESRIQASAKLADEGKGLSLKLNYTGKQFSTADNLIEPLSSFTTLDAGAFYKLNIFKAELVFDAKLNNLLNKRYQVYAYIPQPGFNWQVNTTLNLKW